MAAFDADQRRDLTVLAGAINVVDRQRERKGVGVMADHAMDDVDLFERRLDGRAALHRRGRDVNAPELGADAAGPQAGDVRLQSWLRFGDVDRLEAEVALSSELPGEVVMPVDDNRRLMNPAGLGGDGDRAARRTRRGLHIVGRLSNGDE